MVQVRGNHNKRTEDTLVVVFGIGVGVFAYVFVLLVLVLVYYNNFCDIFSIIKVRVSARTNPMQYAFKHSPLTAVAYARHIPI